MTAREAGSETDGSCRASATRRTFLRASGAIAGLGLPATAVRGGRGGTPGDAVTIDASPAQRDAVRAAVGPVRDARSNGDVSVRVAETTTGLDRLTAGDADVDVVAGSRPMLPAERSRAVENGVDYERREVPTATAALRHPDSAWVDCLPSAGIADTWAGDGAVETWAEVAPETAESVTTRHLPAGDPPVDLERGEHRDARVRPARHGSALVRGVRAYQYASGFGGVGYYEPNDEWLVRSAGAADRAVDSHTSLVRLGFLYVDRDSLERQPVHDVVRAYTHVSANRVGRVPYVETPFGGE